MAVIDVVWSSPAAFEFTNSSNPNVYGYFYDPAFVSGFSDVAYSNFAYKAGNEINKVFLKSATSLSTIWLHFAVRTNLVSSFESGTTPLDGNASIYFYHSNLKQFKMGRGNGSTSEWYFFKTLDNGLSWTQVGTFAVIPDQTAMTLDIKIVVAPVGGEYQVFKDGASIYTFSGDTSSTSGAVSVIELGSGSNTTDTPLYSEMVLADENTVGWRLFTLNINGDNSNTGFLGDWTRVVDTNYTGASQKGVSTNASESSILFEASNTPVNALVVDSVWIAAKRIKTADSIPTKTASVMKIGATVYDHPNPEVVSTNSETTTKNRWNSRPDNNSGWTNSVIDSMSFGYKVAV